MKLLPLAAMTAYIFLSFSAQAMAGKDDVSKHNTTLSISTSAESKIAPDIATISAGVVTQSPSASQALRENTVKMNNVFKSLKAANINSKDIQTSGINITPQYIYEKNLPPKIAFYRVNNTVTVRLKDIENIGSTLDALVSQGVNNLNGPHFSVENPDTALDSARKQAMKKAEKRAELYAEAANLRIKRIISISESVNNFHPRPHMNMAHRMEAMSPDMAAPVAPGEINLKVNVHLNYELEK